MRTGLRILSVGAMIAVAVGTALVALPAMKSRPPVSPPYSETSLTAALVAVGTPSPKMPARTAIVPGLGGVRAAGWRRGGRGRRADLPARSARRHGSGRAHRGVRASERRHEPQ